MSNIYQTINAVMASIGSIGKNQKNQIQNYKFRSVDDIYNKLSPLFAQHGLFVVPNVYGKEVLQYQNSKGTETFRVTLTVDYHVTALDGSFVTCRVVGEGIDTSDKATNKAFTACFKYLMIQLFCIAVEGEVDADMDSPQIIVDNKNNQKQNVQTKGDHNEKSSKETSEKNSKKSSKEVNELDMALGEPQRDLETAEDLPFEPKKAQQSIGDVRAKLIDSFEAIGIRQQRICKKYSIDNWLNLNDEHIIELREIYKQIKQGKLLKNTVFPQVSYFQK